MPRSRRRHHSRSRSRSRSHSHDRERDAKRRKIEGIDSPTHKRSVSCDPQSPASNQDQKIVSSEQFERKEVENGEKGTEVIKSLPEVAKISDDDDIEEKSEDVEPETKEAAETDTASSIETKSDVVEESEKAEQKNALPEDKKPVKQLEEKLTITPKKAMSPKQVLKKLESEKKRQQKQQEREEREKKKLEEKERARSEKEKQKQEKEKLKQEKEELKQKEREQKEKEREMKEEQKRKEREEKEAKRKEKEEREEQKRKERELEKLKRQQELEEKNKEKQKEEEKKQRAAAAFVKFFVPKNPEAKVEEEVKTSLFMPFEIKSDMKLAAIRRVELKEEEKNILVKLIEAQDNTASYLKDLKSGKKIGKSGRTWPYEEDDDVIIVEEDFGETICEEKPKSVKMRAKYLKFHENRRPAYFGTWRKKTISIKPRRPFAEDKKLFDYEVESDDDWEEEEQGESLNGSDDEEKENEVENDDYEVDNEFFVPHGHLSDDEIDDEATSKLSPESHKQKLKLLKDEFDQDMQTKTNKMKPRSIGCIWYNKDGSNVEEAIDRHLRPLAMITNGQIILQKRKSFVVQTPTRKYAKEMREELIPKFLKLIHGNANKRTTVVDEFITYMQNNGFVVEVSKAYLSKRLKEFAQWKKCTQEGPMLNKFCWCVEDDVKKKYNVEF